MNLLLIANAVTCVCALIGFIFGLIKFFRPKKAVYAQMISLAVGTMAFGRLYQVVRLLTLGDITEHFQLGVLGVIGSLIFFFSANYGVMDSIADDGSEIYRKYRGVAVIAPVAALILYAVFFLFADLPLLVKIVSGVITFVIMCASYYNLKHLIFPDVDFGVINCLKAYNLLALGFETLSFAEMVTLSRGSDSATLIVNILMSIILVLILPMVDRGIKKWTT